jgi:hypothetical protein
MPRIIGWRRNGAPIYLIAGGSSTEAPPAPPDTPPDTPPDEPPDTPEPKPTETVDFWKAKAREQERRAKANADAAKRLQDLEDAQKSEKQKLEERTAAAERERDEARVESLRLKVAIAKKLPAELAERLRGETEDELTADAESLLALVKDPGKRSPDFDGGTRRTDKPSAKEAGLAEARRRFGEPAAQK